MHKLTSPHDATPKLWIRYMAFRLSLADVEGARAVAARALKTILFREEGEKMNVWVALLNLEHKFGTKASLAECVKKATAAAHPKRIHLHLAKIYEDAEETTEAAETYATAVKRFKTSKKVWSAYIRFELRGGDDAAARQLLQRSLQSLAKHKHVFVISKFAQVRHIPGSVSLNVRVGVCLVAEGGRLGRGWVRGALRPDSLQSGSVGV